MLQVSNQPAVQEIHVPVLELFGFLPQNPSVEIVDLLLPEPGQRIFQALEVEFELSWRHAPVSAQSPFEVKRRAVARQVSPESANLLQQHLVEAVAELLGQIQCFFIGTREGMHGVEPSWQSAELAEFSEDLAA